MQGSEDESQPVRFPEVSLEEIDAVLAFLSELESAEAGLGHSRSGEAKKISAFISSDFTSRLEQALYRTHLISSFNWPEWMKSLPPWDLMSDWVASADLLDLRKLLTAHVRQERFCEGHLMGVVESGHIRDILRRLKEIRIEMKKTGGDPVATRRNFESTRLTLQDRFRGALLGLAAGDALGTPLEFKPPGSFRPISDMVGGGPFRLKPGQWTDDTSMALCLASSLLERDGFDPQDQLERYLRWWQEGYLSSTGRCFDIGNTVRSALERFEKTGQPYPGSRDPYSAGNGSIMRLVPVVLYYNSTPHAALYWAERSSQTTHSAREAVDACAYFAMLLLGILRGDSKEEVLSKLPSQELFDPRSLEPKIRDIAEGSFRRKEPPEIKGSGYVVQSLEAALWAFHKSDSFEEGALLAVNLGDDADTTGAIFGQIAGAYYGESGIPRHWLDRLHLRSEISALADRLERGKGAAALDGGAPQE